MQGLKENVAVGRLIPAGTGTPEYNDLIVGVDGLEDGNIEGEMRWRDNFENSKMISVFLVKFY